MTPTFDAEPHLPTREPELETRTATAETSPADNSPSSEAPDAVAKQGWGAYAVVALIALLIGAAGMFAALRFLGRGGTSPTGTAAMSPPSLAAAQPESMPGMDMSAPGTGEHPTDAKGNVVYISPARQQLIGVRTATVDAPGARDDDSHGRHAGV